MSITYQYKNGSSQVALPLKEGRRHDNIEDVACLLYDKVYAGASPGVVDMARVFHMQTPLAPNVNSGLESGPSATGINRCVIAYHRHGKAYNMHNVMTQSTNGKRNLMSTVLFVNIHRKLCDFLHRYK